MPSEKIENKNELSNDLHFTSIAVVPEQMRDMSPPARDRDTTADPFTVNTPTVEPPGNRDAPKIRTHEAIIQDDDSMLVPGGFLHYILMDKACGVQLSEEIFWAYSRSERDRIREAYKEAWRYVMLYLPKCLASPPLVFP
ncbi:hypothetical protein BJX62DRAFT_238973 [Aspergillus germanicus]